MQTYQQQAFEIHQVTFEGHLGSYGNQVTSLLALKKRLLSVISSLHSGEAFDAHEWKITDIDSSLYK